MTLQSVELMVYVFLREPWSPKEDIDHNWEWYNKSLAVTEEIVLKMLRIAKKLDMEVAVPHQKVHMGEPGGLAVKAEPSSKKFD
jgi:hypothetical protein